MKISAFIYSGLCGCCLWAAGCSNEVLDADAEARAPFFLTTRAYHRQAIHSPAAG